MIKAIIYESNAGHTKEYAEMLSRKRNLPCYTIKEAKGNLKANDEIVFLGWVFAGKITGLDKVKVVYNLKCIGAVGGYKEEKEYIENLKKTNGFSDNLFYLRGGVEIHKLKGIKKMMLKIMGSMLEKENKEGQSDVVELFKNGANFVSDENLIPIIKYLEACNK